MTDKKDGSDSSAVFETATLAEIFIRQGHLKKGLDIYRKLSRFESGNPRYQKKIIELAARIEKEGPVAEADLNAPGPGAWPTKEGFDQSDQVVSKEQGRVLETLNKWLIAIRKRKKHVQ